MSETHLLELAGFDPELDLKLERVVELPKELIWKAWTQEKHLKEWFCPRPWSVTKCAIDLRPGGAFQTTMRSPEGEEFPGTGCYLEVVANRKLVWTDALLPGYRPAVKAQAPGFMFTGMIFLDDHKDGTRYTAVARHGSAEDAKKHEEMGFHQGWGIALDQLLEYMKTV